MNRPRLVRGNEKELPKQISVIVVFVVLIFGAGWAAYSTFSSHKELDAETLCPAEPSSVTVLLVDVTDTLSVAQRQDFRNQLEIVQSSIPRYGQILVYKVDRASEKLLDPVITLCNPGTAADVSDVNSNPKKIQQQHDEQFIKPLGKSFEELFIASNATKSPILESIQSVAITALKNKKIPRRLIVVSDLLQNTDDLSFYGKIPSAKDVLSANYFRSVRTDLRGVEVNLWVLERPDARTSQPQDLIDLWDALITAQDGSVEDVKQISG